MQYEGNIFKMRTEQANPVNYFLPVGEDEIKMNDFTGKEIDLFFTGRINCISCGKLTKRSFSQGFCYSCLQTAPEAGESVIRPELSKAQFGIARDMEWAKKHDLIDHIVYLSFTSELKVGVTRHTQIPTRWIDQGAAEAIQLAKTPNRHIAGVIEVFLKRFYNDRTNWRAMLKNRGDSETDLLKEKKKIYELLPAELKKYYFENDEITKIKYPVNQFSGKIKSTGFDKTPDIKGVLSGIKGQYLIFDDGMVLNIRKYNGYYLKIELPA